MAQTQGDSLFFPETGHWVTNEFLEKYNSVPNNRELFGLPITDVIVDEDTGLLIQYFEKARFELHPGASPELRVQLTPLGEYLYSQGEVLPIPPNFPSCRHFPETDHKVCYAFLDFFEANGGVLQFGYPLSGFETHDGWIVQYFQRARFEWHPERHAGEQVVLSNLGTRFFRFTGEDSVHLQPNVGNHIPMQSVSNLSVHAFVSSPITQIGGVQTLNVIVYDQTFHPVESAVVAIVVKLPKEEPIEKIMAPTDKRGLSNHEFVFEGSMSGTAEIIVTVTYDTIRKQTRTSFQLW
ncbi:MAG: hypothetical protein U9Q82_06740 [Chloroflexota bacterium]|nr:hypothetical protein [Chloroflexota bacterium]